MSDAALDRTLALLIAALVTSGLLTLRAGSPGQTGLFALHALLAGLLVAAVAMKLRRSVPRAWRGRRWGRLALGLVVSLLAIAGLSGGFLWAASGRILQVGPWTILTLHAWVGLILVPFAVLHLLPHRWRLLRPRLPGGGAGGPIVLLSRRRLLAGGALLAVAAALPGAALAVERLLGGERRFTGSRWLPAGGVPPATTFFGEGAPPLDPASWRLRVEGRVRQPLSLELAALRGLGETEMSAVLDCTSGWAVETDWRGVSLGTLLALAGAAADSREITVRSATGWSTSLSLDEAQACLLATGVAGQDLGRDNGAPCRLVAPERRGLDWVKWVAAVTVA